ncbi:tRNA 2-thiouridine-synthesizing protein [Pseudoalteromonas porphyrae]|uniref:tRNA 2-thiouridine-synthesizing protein n=2 Tax=Pseudoalteromonas TaxID=53246 RepID=A0A0N1END3_9GAMM|nr:MULTISPECIES: DsrH/TusB family sulfur metabolism protein [Pseudoalteromonas]KPH65002.1 tRNA 2-thiouridine-synthesizing protein [Pseudoalteromonas porphyrae]KPH95094.1 tRNA 2-thiouridine-synthesizing protein [Pseudoalteromonas porphyrae]NMR25956.1 tRNA 2-thiouridine-synthesizing protein [Pseudoalteromonas sp. NEC-BIFX-2020_015]NNG43818.1 tRNA 2-thiouridine-synthesizing protein [Pseudoalteromonas sp. NEC-BIFX-2020_002]
MSTLHIFSKPISYYATERLANLIQEHDSVLLVGDACYSTYLYRQFSSDLLFLAEDALARGLTINESDNALNYADFVALTLSTSQSITW